MDAPGYLHIRNFLESGPQPYEPVWQAMQQFTRERDKDAVDEIWLMEHQPVYTLGQAGDPSHIISAAGIPVVKVDRGGQVTYHGPGQLMFYTLIDIARLGIGVRDLVVLLEDAVVELLREFDISARGDRKAPGVYVENKKIAALGLRVSGGCTYHGLCLNVDFDAAPFDGINPCGYAGMQVTQLREILAARGDFLPAKDRLAATASRLTEIVAKKLGLNPRYQRTPSSLATTGLS